MTNILKIISLFLLALNSMNAQTVRFFVDIPKIDGEYGIPSNRKTNTTAPKNKCTLINYYEFQLAKAVYIKADKEIENKVKSNDFQTLRLVVPLDKSYNEFQKRLVQNSILPTLDIFSDYGVSNSFSEIVHLKLINVKILKIKLNIMDNNNPNFTIDVKYDKIISASTERNLDGTLKATIQTCLDIKNGINCNEKI